MKDAHDLVADAKKFVSEIPVGEAVVQIKNADLLLDVREPEEYKQGHIPGAMNIPRGLLEFKMSSTPELGARDKSIVVYCKTSGRAALAAKSLQEMGYVNVKSIAGGFDVWLEQGQPIARPEDIDYD